MKTVLTVYFQSSHCNIVQVFFTILRTDTKFLENTINFKIKNRKKIDCKIVITGIFLLSLLFNRLNINSCLALYKVL